MTATYPAIAATADMKAAQKQAFLDANADRDGIIDSIDRHYNGGGHVDRYFRATEHALAAAAAFTALADKNEPDDTATLAAMKGLCAHAFQIAQGLRDRQIFVQTGLAHGGGHEIPYTEAAHSGMAAARAFVGLADPAAPADRALAQDMQVFCAHAFNTARRYAKDCPFSGTDADKYYNRSSLGTDAAASYQATATFIAESTLAGLRARSPRLA